jgi:hemin uptake protein HemP
MFTLNPRLPTEEAGGDELRAVLSSELLAGRRQLIIKHEREQYRLQLTNSNKLILTK